MKTIPLLILFLFAFLSCGQDSNNAIQDSEGGKKKPLAAPKDTEISNMVQEISVDSIRAYIGTMVDFGTRHSLSDTVSDTRGIGAARRWVKSKFEEFGKASSGRLKAILDPYVVQKSGRIPHDVLMKNAMATLKGTDPDDDRVLIVSGHLDSRVSDVMDAERDAPGANDDASGVAVVMELCRVMSKREFPLTIIFVAVQGEEQGLFGATHLARKCRQDSINVIAMFNNDIVGNTISSNTNIKDSTRVRVFSETIPAFETDNMRRLRRRTGAENDSKSRQLARYIKELGESYVENFEVVLNYRTDRFLRGGDHTPFSRNGFTAIRMCEINENFVHQHQDIRVEDGIQYGDLPEFVDYNYTAKVARVNLAAMANLAYAPYEPQNVGLKFNLNNNTTLVWDKPKGKEPAGYNILLRETYQSNWEQKIYVTDTTATIPYSKDNYFFAVQSVDADGHSSLPVFPRPVR
ncbi:M28 family metallopeptidase [Fulvivirgaceae bacterium BMA10]|uniref:M28 family metallopeptidase n=1 Tax=Splendidivirga corallicola TaxID=3051826 RepID=A0ABT8KJI2_9BACT|nr:M28 family metallopeptidase [Fulvivirgaceae bacterium BMA10]